MLDDDPFAATRREIALLEVTEIPEVPCDWNRAVSNDPCPRVGIVQVIFLCPGRGSVTDLLLCVGHVKPLAQLVIHTGHILLSRIA